MKRTKIIWIASIKLIHLVQISLPWVLQACQAELKQMKLADFRLVICWFNLLRDLMILDADGRMPGTLGHDTFGTHSCCKVWGSHHQARRASWLAETFKATCWVFTTQDIWPESRKFMVNHSSLRKLTQLRSKSPPKSPSRSRASARFFGEKLAEIQRDAWVWLRFCFQFCRRNPPFYHVARWCLMGFLGFLTCAQSWSSLSIKIRQLYILKNMIKTWSGKGENRNSKERESRSVPTFPAWNSGDLLVPVISCGSCLTSSVARQLNQGSRHRGALGRVWCAFATCGLSLWWRSFLWCCVCFFGKGLVSLVLPIENSPLGELLIYIESVICSSKSWGSQPLWRARRPFQRTSRCGVFQMEVPENWSLQTGLWFFTSIDICLMDLMDGDCWCSATLQWRMADNFPYESCIGSKIHVKPRG